MPRGASAHSVANVLCTPNLPRLDEGVLGQGQVDENFETGTVAGTYTTLAGGRSESRIEGSGKFSGAAGVGGMYEGQVHCDDGFALG